jgi:hypothetical protein
MYLGFRLKPDLSVYLGACTSLKDMYMCVNVVDFGLHEEVVMVYDNDLL